MWADLAEARFQEAVRTDDAEMHVSALAAADRALEIDPHYEQAAVHRTRALEAIGISKSGVAAAFGRWNTEIPTLEAAVRSGDRARVRHIVERYAQQARTWGEGEFLARWGDATIAGDAMTATHWLAVARAIGVALRDATGEALLLDSVSTIERADAVRRANLARAHVLYRRARMLYSERRVDAALAALRQAETGFAYAASPMAHVAAYYVANALTDDQQKSEARAVARRLSRDVPAQHIALTAQVHWLRALVLIDEARYFDALAEYRAAIAGFDKLREHESALRMRGSYASLLCRLGEPRKAWRLWRTVLRGAAMHGRPALTEVTLNDAARHELRRGRVEEARSLLRLELSARTPSPRLHVDALTSLAMIDGSTGRDTAHFDRARVSLQRLNGSLRDDAEDQLKFAQAVYVERDPQRSLALLGDVIVYRERIQRLPDLVAAYVARARFLMPKDAVRDLERAIAVTESTRERIASAELRDSFLGASADAYLELARLHASMDRLDAAFEVADRSRARLIAEQTGMPSSVTAFTIADLQRRLGDDVVVLHYTSFADGLMIVAVSRERWKGTVVDVPRARLARMPPDALYGILIQPVRPLLHRGATLVIVSDATTSRIPFAALRTPDSKRLIQEHAMAYAPSAASFRGVLTDAPPAATATVVTDPAFDRDALGDFPRLPAAASDYAAVSTAFAKTRTFHGADATIADVLAAAQMTEALHIAAHALANERDASTSLIALAPGTDDNGLLYSRDIARLELEHLRLVFLAGCRTALVTRTNRSASSLALAFLTARTGSVVGTLWNIDDVHASAITRSFYRSLRERVPLAEALRRAQVAAIASGLPEEAWSAFQLHTTGRAPEKNQRASVQERERERNPCH